MKSSLDLLSIGLRCMEMGFSFIWLSEKTPCFITPSMKMIPLDVVQNIPYLKADGIGSHMMTDAEIESLTGLCIRDGAVVICDEENVAVPGPAESADIGAESASDTDSSESEEGDGTGSATPRLVSESQFVARCEIWLIPLTTKRRTSPPYLTIVTVACVVRAGTPKISKESMYVNPRSLTF